jgi:RNA polymerase sigma-70 factor (ECF subfamily)
MKPKSELLCGSDEQLIEWVVQKDLSALEVLFDRYAQALYLLSLRIVRQPAIAEGLLQEIFWGVWHGEQRCPHPMNVGGWLWRVTRTQSLNYIRQHRQSI